MARRKRRVWKPKPMSRADMVRLMEHIEAEAGRQEKALEEGCMEIKEPWDDTPWLSSVAPARKVEEGEG
jgi:hypothetical protein